MCVMRGSRKISIEGWEAIYERILEDFGFDRQKDEESARRASEILSRKLSRVGKDIHDLEGELMRIIEGNEVIICGNSHNLDEEIRSTDTEGKVIISADGATSVLLHHAIIPDIIVTDLDGFIADIIFANRLGAFVVVHAHGDNMEQVRDVLPELNERVICTTQSRPFGIIRNYGGFTDGDRCAFLAVHFGASKTHFIGFDLNDERVSERKRKKLKWAKWLIEDVLGLSVGSSWRSP